MNPKDKKQATRRHSGAQKTGKSKKWDPFAEGRNVLEAMQQEEGGALNPKEAAQRLNLSVRTLVARAERNQLVAWREDKGLYRFPAWQFGTSGLLPGISECLEELAGHDQWAQMKFFLAESDYLQGRRPLDLLRDGQIKKALELARSCSIGA